MFTFLLMIEDEQERNKLEELYLTYRKELFYTAYQILHDYHDAEDVIQSAFIKIYKYLDKISEINCKKTRGYLVIIVRNLSYDRYKEKKRTLPVDFLDETAVETEISDSSLEEYILNLEAGKELAEALTKLKTRDADIMTLKYYYEYSLTEIADLMNLSNDMVSVRITRAKKALKKILSERGK